MKLWAPSPVHCHIRNRLVLITVGALFHFSSPQFFCWKFSLFSLPSSYFHFPFHPSELAPPPNPTTPNLATTNQPNTDPATPQPIQLHQHNQPNHNHPPPTNLYLQPPHQHASLTHKTQQTDLYPQPTHQHANLKKRKKKKRNEKRKKIKGRRVQGRSTASGGRDGRSWTVLTRRGSFWNFYGFGFGFWEIDGEALCWRGNEKWRKWEMGSAGKLTEGSDLVIRYGSYKKVEIFELCEVKTVSKRWVVKIGVFWVMSDDWWMMSDEWWKLSDENWLTKQALNVQIHESFGTQYANTQRS